MKATLTLFFTMAVCISNAQLSGVDDASYNPTDLGYDAGGAIFAKKIYPQTGGKFLVGNANKVQRLMDDGTFDPTFNDWVPPVPLKNYGLHYQQPDSFSIISYGFSSSFTNLIRISVDGVFDPSFDSTLKFDREILTIARQSDDKLIVGGSFLTVGIDSVFRITRLLPNGQRDLSFNSGTGINASQTTINQGLVRQLVVDSLDRILVIGELEEYNGQPVPQLIRLLPDGTLDTTFNFFAINGTILSIAALPNGKTLVGGYFSTSGGYRNLLRLNNDGSLDSTFNNQTINSTNGTIVQIHLMNDGRICIVGSFSMYSGIQAFGLVRITPDGISDSSLVSRGFDSFWFTCMTTDSLDNLLVGGSFRRYGDAGKVGLVRILNDGTPDYNFNVGNGFNFNYVNDIAIQSDGKHLVAGYFTSHNNFTTVGLARLNADGSTDTTFRFLGDNLNNPTLHTSQFTNVAVLPGGKILAGNYYSKLIRLFPGGTIDSSFSAPLGYLSFNHFEVLPNGMIVAACEHFNAGHTIIRMFPDGTQDLTFNIGVFAESPIRFAIQPNGKLVVVGNLLDYTFNGNTQFASNAIRINTNGTPDLSFSVTGLAANGINTVNVLSNGKILLGLNAGLQGSAGRVVRVLANGQPDLTFTTNSFGRVKSVIVQPDNKILVGGFGSCNFSNPCGNITRLNSNGGYDLTFNSGTGYTNIDMNFGVCAMAWQNDWRAIVGGDFTAYNTVGRNRINRIMLADTVCGVPPSGIQLSITGNTICNGDSITLYRQGGSLPPGGAFKWYSGSCGTNLIGVGDSITIGPSSTGNIYVRTEGGCGNSVCATVLINVLALPVPSMFGDTTLCAGDTTTLGLTPNYGTYLWSNGSTAATTSVSNTGTYTVTVTNANGCSASRHWNVTVYPYPTVNIIAGGPVSFCRGDSVTLSASAGLTSWQWYRNGLLWGTNSPNLTIFTAGIYHCIGANAASCADTSNTIQVWVPCIPIGPSYDKQSQAESPFTIFPNPASDLLLIKANTGTIRIFNPYGALVLIFEMETGQTEIDISNFVTGLYLIQNETTSGTKIKKLMIRKQDK